METKHTKGEFKDGHTGWKIDNRITNGSQGFEIHYSDDGECITDRLSLTFYEVLVTPPFLISLFSYQ